MSEIVIAGKPIDVCKALPLTIGDWKKLSAQGIDARALEKAGFNEAFTLAYYVISKAEPSITQEMFDALPLEADGGVIKKVIDAISAGKEQAQSNLPFSEPC